jgi:hypothetical protein
MADWQAVIFFAYLESFPKKYFAVCCFLFSGGLAVWG